MTTPTLRHALLALAILLAACGTSGSGGDTDRPPGAPTLTLTPTAITTFLFTWPASDDASDYRLLEDASGEGDLQPIATVSGSATSYLHEVSLPGRINARYQLQACNQHGCTASDIVPVVGTLTEAIGYVKASNARADARFGWSVALAADGATLAVGAPFESSSASGIGGDQNDSDAPDSGAVYVFVRTAPGTWAQQAYVKASNTDEGDRFGYSLALSSDGTTLAVGAPREASISKRIDGGQDNNDAPRAGAVYVFARDGATWAQQAYLKANNTAAGSEFGHSVALSADGATLAVGARHESSNATGVNGDGANRDAPRAGAAYVFVRASNGAWRQQAYVKASNTTADDRFGFSIALSGDGDTLAVGAPEEDSSATGVDGDEDDNEASNAGAVYVFTRDSDTWAQHAYVKASNTARAAGFGTAVALSADGTTLAVGAPGENSGATGIDGDQSNEDVPRAGAVYVFIRQQGTWAQQAYVKAGTAEVSASFGTSLALAADGTVLAVGATGDTGDATGIDGARSDTETFAAGAAYVFVRTGTGTWSQQAYVKASNTAERQSFGRRVALTGDGRTLTVGADGEASGAAGIGGDQNDSSADRAGAAYLY